MLPTPIRHRHGWDEPPLPLERAFDRMARWHPFRGWEPETTAAYPVDIREDDGTVVVDAELPGFKKDEVDVSLDQGVLRITAERKASEVEGTRHLSERQFTRVERAFTLPVEVDESNVRASLQEGVLHLELPKTGRSAPRRIPVE